MPFTYILFSKSCRKTYTGCTSRNDVNLRLSEHNLGKTKSTRKYKPWILIHYEEHDTFEEARHKELWLKSRSGRRWMKENIPFPKD